MPRRIYHTDSSDRRPKAVVANGTPLAVRMIRGKPYSSKIRLNTGLASCTAVDRRPWQASRYRPVAVDDRQGIPVLAVAGLELSFEVGGPDRVGFVHRRHGAPGVAGIAPTL